MNHAWLPVQVVAPKELVADEEYDEILEDMREECGKYGKLYSGSSGLEVQAWNEREASVLRRHHCKLGHSPPWSQRRGATWSGKGEDWHLVPDLTSWCAG